MGVNIISFRGSISSMCDQCRAGVSRRTFFAGVAAGLAGAIVGEQAFAQTAPPKPENILAPDDALARLLKGNERYVSGNVTSSRFNDVRDALTKGQNPYAAILGCADSRVSPELIFDENQGDLFVTRIAGNFVTKPLLASLEYSVAVLKTPLIFVLGHTSCGAISAAVQAVTKDADFPGHIQSLTTSLAPAVRAAKAKKPTDLVVQATIENVRISVEKLSGSTPILRRAVREGRLKVAGGVYQLATGKIERVV
jgi:carbonic anhydrase